MAKETITIQLPHKMVEKIITDHVLKEYGEILGAKTAKDLKWNDYSLMVGENGLEFTGN
jgi:hypothetical protein